jgi:DNA-binding transcriptional LysR family regulator
MVFLGLMRHRNATAVAREMGLTQPAISHALKRLRTLYNDPLFLRRAHGFEPTTLARGLEPKVQQIVRLLAETLSDERDFDPCTQAFEFRLGSFDYENATLVPQLVADLRTVNPSIRLHAYPLTNREALDALVQGRIDMAIGYFDPPLKDRYDLRADTLCTERYVVVARQGHPLLTGQMTLAKFAAADHLLISPYGPVSTMVDHALKLNGMTRDIQTTVPSLFGALMVVEQSDLIVTMPRRVVSQHTQRFKIGYAPTPFAGGAFLLHSLRHSRDAKSVVHDWMLERLSLLFEEDEIDKFTF